METEIKALQRVIDVLRRYPKHPQPLFSFFCFNVGGYQSQGEVYSLMKYVDAVISTLKQTSSQAKREDLFLKVITKLKYAMDAKFSDDPLSVCNLAKECLVCLLTISAEEIRTRQSQLMRNRPLTYRFRAPYIPPSNDQLKCQAIKQLISDKYEKLAKTVSNPPKLKPR